LIVAYWPLSHYCSWRSRRGVIRDPLDTGNPEVPEGFAEAVEEFRAAQGKLEVPDWLR
jgi:hypothetical protein